MKKIAHVRKNLETGTWESPHLLKKHLLGTATFAEKFANVFFNGDWALAAGLIHDLGKGSRNFQEYIRSQSGYDTDAHLENMNGKVIHSTHGAVWTYQKWQTAGKILAYLIAGHHAGLPDWTHKIGIGGNLADRLKEDEIEKLPLLDDQFISETTTAVVEPTSSPCGNQLSDEQIHLWVRMLYSCLVDADFLDTERYMGLEKFESRGQQNSIVILKEHFDQYMRKFEATPSKEQTVVNKLRNKILYQCRTAAKEKPGLYTLTVPTGGGKTLSAMAFALEHAQRHNKERIIMVIPYTSIIEQTSKIYREIFGDQNVIEHHSSLDPESETSLSRLATENWDAPIIVTTSVQFFESLFAARSSACRKLHNIVNSIVIVDEVQMLPTDYLKPILQVIDGLTRHFGVSMVLCSATQPAITGTVGEGKARFSVLPENSCHEIMQSPSPEELTRLLQRVKLVQAGKYIDWSCLAMELTKYEQVLCIVNTRKDCRELFDMLPDGTVHLSANMCAEHRSKIIASIKEHLKNGESIRVVSTQLVEAGVDIDFPVVYRAMAGFDSIAQAAGRCNREGKLRDKEGDLIIGKVTIFDPPRPAPIGSLRKGEEAGKTILATDPEGCKNLIPSTLKKYFKLYFGDLNNFDKQNMQALLVNDANPDLDFQFRTAAQKFKLIDDQEQISIVVKYAGNKNDSRRLIKSLRDFGPNRTLMRQLQRFTISIPKPIFSEMQGSFEEIRGIWCQYADTLYDDTLGFVGYDGDIPII